jgi:DNA-binding SARP family transcriptional activator
MRFRLLGPVEVRTDHGWQPIGPTKSRSLLAVLLLRSGQMIPVDRLVTELWPERPPAAAVSLVRGYVLRVRRLIGDPAGAKLQTCSGGYRLDARPHDTDVQVFEGLFSEGERLLQTGHPGRADDVLGEGLALWRGPAVADVPSGPIRDGEAARLEEQKMAAIETRIDAALARGKHSEMVACLHRAMAEHPFWEGLCARLMVALYRGGRRAEALEAFTRTRKRMIDELGLEPGHVLRTLHRSILTDDSAFIHPIDAQTPPPYPAANEVSGG